MPSRSAICEVATESAKAAGRKRPGPEEWSRDRVRRRAGRGGVKPATMPGRTSCDELGGRAPPSQHAFARAGVSFYVARPLFPTCQPAPKFCFRERRSSARR